MSKGKLKTFINTGEFEIIDEWTHHWIADLPWEEAFEKYGECEVWSSYTNGSCKYQNASGKTPSWNTAVWIWIPGLHGGYSNRNPFTIPGEVVMNDGNRTITFIAASPVRAAAAVISSSSEPARINFGQRQARRRASALWLPLSTRTARGSSSVCC